jgi:hypothetical protein
LGQGYGFTWLTRVLIWSVRQEPRQGILGLGHSDPKQLVIGRQALGESFKDSQNFVVFDLGLNGPARFLKQIRKIVCCVRKAESVAGTQRELIGQFAQESDALAQFDFRIFGAA